MRTKGTNPIRSHPIQNIFSQMEQVSSFGRPSFAVFHPLRAESSGTWKCAIVGVPWPGPVSACLAWVGLFVKNMLEKMPKRPSLLRHHGTPLTARHTYNCLNSYCGNPYLLKQEHRHILRRPECLDDRRAENTTQTPLDRVLTCGTLWNTEETRKHHSLENSQTTQTLLDSSL